MPHENDPTRATALDDKRRARIGRNVVSVTPTNKREAIRALINEEEAHPDSVPQRPSGDAPPPADGAATATGGAA